jgi:hypothetical protein
MLIRIRRHSIFSSELHQRKPEESGSGAKEISPSLSGPSAPQHPPNIMKARLTQKRTRLVFSMYQLGF